MADDPIADARERLADAEEDQAAALENAADELRDKASADRSTTGGGTDFLSSIGL
jgi:hypothetical protein